MGNANPPNSPATIDIDKIVQGIAEWLPKGMGLVLKAEIQDLITEKENRARLEETQLYKQYFRGRTQGFANARIDIIEATLKSKGKMESNSDIDGLLQRLEDSIGIHRVNNKGRA